MAAEAAVAAGSPWFRLGEEYRIAAADPADGGWRVTVEGIYDTYDDLHLGLHGRHQVDNLAVAIAAVESLFGRALDPDAVREAAATATSPGRMEIVDGDPPLMLDGAHNPPGMSALTGALAEEFPGQRWQVVFGAMADKDIPAMLDMLAPHAAGFTMVAAESDRAKPAADLAEMAEGLGLGVPVQAAGPVPAGLKAARASGEPVLVAGSLYVVGEARLALGLA